MQLQPSPLQRNEKPVKLSKNLVTEQIVTTVRRLFPPAIDLFLVSHRFLLLFSSCPPLLKMLPTSTRVFFFLRLLLGPLSVFLPPFLTPLSTRFIFFVISLFFFITQPSTWCVTLFPPFALPSTPFFRFTFFFGFKGGCVTFYMGGLPPPI